MQQKGFSSSPRKVFRHQSTHLTIQSETTTNLSNFRDLKRKEIIITNQQSTKRFQSSSNPKENSHPNFASTSSQAFEFDDEDLSFWDSVAQVADEKINATPSSSNFKQNNNAFRENNTVNGPPPVHILQPFSNTSVTYEETIYDNKQNKDLSHRFHYSNNSEPQQQYSDFQSGNLEYSNNSEEQYNSLNDTIPVNFFEQNSFQVNEESYSQLFENSNLSQFSNSESRNQTQNMNSPQNVNTIQNINNPRNINSQNMNISQKTPDPDWAECGLPVIVKNIFEEKGIKKMYPWQLDVLRNPKIHEGKNFLISLPTSGGKTLPAEIMTLKYVLLKKMKVIIILPYVSIVTEKMNSMSLFGSKLGFTVEGYYNSYGMMPMPSRINVALCTIEKANNLINQLIEDNRLKEIGLVVVDELHMLDEPDRGYILELLLTKVLFLSRGTIQIIGMSATVPNLEEIASWLNAECYISNFRPVRLVEKFKVNNIIYDNEGKEISKLPYDKNGQAGLDGLFELCYETISNPNQSVLIFCGTKAETQSLAMKLSELMPNDIRENKQNERQILLQRLKFANSGGIDPCLSKTIPCGIAFHNSGLTVDERELIEEAYHSRALSVLVSTSTLAAGVNLPARRVIIHGLKVGRNQTISIRQYKQECGRAGRAGIDDYGESILMIKANEKDSAFKFIKSLMKPIKSCLIEERGGRGFKRLILESICGKYANKPEEVHLFINYTFLASEIVDKTKLKNQIDESFNYLLKHQFCIKEVKEGKEIVKPTELGDATYHTSFSPEEILQIQAELERSTEHLVLKDELHLTYIITPMNNLPLVDWEKYEKIFSGLPDIRRYIAKIIGVEHDFLMMMASPNRQKPPESTLKRAQRFFFAMALCELVNEANIMTVQSKYGVDRGALQSLMQSGQSFASQLVNFLKTMNVWQLHPLLSAYCQRLNFGVKPDILPLTEITGIKKVRARNLYNAGYRSVKQIALAEPDKLAQDCYLGPFNTKGVAATIIRHAKELLERKAQELRITADEMLQQL